MIHMADFNCEQYDVSLRNNRHLKCVFWVGWSWKGEWHLNFWHVIKMVHGANKYSRPSFIVMTTVSIDVGKEDSYKWLVTYQKEVLVSCMCLCVWRLSRLAKAASDVDYPAYGSTGTQYEPTTPESKSAAVVSHSDRKLAHSAQMFHFQHQKQQMLQLERSLCVHGSLSSHELYVCMFSYFAYLQAGWRQYG